MKTKRGTSVALWMLKSVNTNSFLANNTQAFMCPAYWLCPYDEICESEIVVSEDRRKVEEHARWWNKFHWEHKVEPIKVRVSLEFLEEATDEE